MKREKWTRNRKREKEKIRSEGGDRRKEWQGEEEEEQRGGT
jgi:hypothetical protein